MRQHVVRVPELLRVGVFVSGNGLTCDFRISIKPEQHMKIKVCGSGFVY